MRREGPASSLRFTIVLGTVCALVLTGVGRWTAPRREAHRRASELRGVLAVLDLAPPEQAGSEELLRRFESAVRPLPAPGGTAYARRDGAPLVALRFEGAGLWGPMRGYLSVDRRQRRIHRFVVLSHEETPGIGGKVAEDEFAARLAGRPLGEAGRVFVLVAPGTASAAGEVDGIAGATMSCRKLQAMVSRVLEVHRALWDDRRSREGGRR